MYIPPHSLIKDIPEIHSFIEKNSFAILVTKNNGTINATHIPFLIEKNEGIYGTLYCHIAKANSQWKDFDKEALVIFPGAHHYISSSWYETDQSVPTWNYLSVHAYGEMEIVNDRGEKIRIVKDLVKYFEGEGSTYSTDNLRESYFKRLLNGIVAFRICITKLEGKQKLSQNRSKESQKRVISELEKSVNDDAKLLAELMKKHLDNKHKE